MSIKPILFNTEMVQAILDGRKTVTRRAVKMKGNPAWTGYLPDGLVLYGGNNIPAAKSPYHPGDILWVRETFSPVWVRPIRYLYKCFCPEAEGLPVRWHPSIHMPKSAARLFLRVVAVRVERLRDIECIATEGITMVSMNAKRDSRYYFAKLWNSTIKPADLPRYGWGANPFVWVVEFERCERPEGWA